MMISRLPSQRMHVRLVGRQGQAVLVIASHQKSKVGKKRRKTVLLARSNALLEMVVLVVVDAANANHNSPSAAACKK
jgi:hypothetical protein